MELYTYLLIHDNMHIFKYPISISYITTVLLFFRHYNILHNSVIRICIFLTSSGIFLFEQTNNYMYLFLLFYVFIINEIAYVMFGFDIFDSHARTEINYSSAYLTELLQNKQFNKINSNLTEGLYPDYKYVDSDKAEINRFDKFMQLSNIEPGDTLLDAGCGNGNLVEYMRSKGVDAHGVTITNYQYKNNVKRFGEHYTHGDYTILHKNLINKFDHIILPGSLEHPFGGCVFTIDTTINKCIKMTEMFEMFKKYYKKDSKKKNLLTTCIHTHELNHPIWNIKNKVIAYCTERMFGGCYPSYGRYSVAESMRRAGYKIKKEEDYTKDYYLSSYYTLEHFGNPADLTMETLSFFWFYPIMIHSWFYWKYGMWMWMWSGRLHKRRNEDECICDINKSCDLYYEENFDKRPCSLLYTVSSCN